MRRAIYPGTFDPITNGHLDIAERALRLFDEVIIAVALNAGKGPLFSWQERVSLVEQSVSQLQDSDRLRVGSFDQLLVEYAKSQGACAVIRGLRAVSDFEFEFQLALMNRKLNPDLETIFLMPKESYTYLSSRMIKEIARLGGAVDNFVPQVVEQEMLKRFSS